MPRHLLEIKNVPYPCSLCSQRAKRRSQQFVTPQDAALQAFPIPCRQMAISAPQMHAWAPLCPLLLKNVLAPAESAPHLDVSPSCHRAVLRAGFPTAPLFRSICRCSERITLDIVIPRRLRFSARQWVVLFKNHLQRRWQYALRCHFPSHYQRGIGGQYSSRQLLTMQWWHLNSHLHSSLHASSSICMKSLILIFRIQLNCRSSSEQLKFEPASEIMLIQTRLSPVKRSIQKLTFLWGAFPGYVHTTMLSVLSLALVSVLALS